MGNVSTWDVWVTHSNDYSYWDISFCPYIFLPQWKLAGGLRLKWQTGLGVSGRAFSDLSACLRMNSMFDVLNLSEWLEERCIFRVLTHLIVQSSSQLTVLCVCVCGCCGVLVKDLSWKVKSGEFEPHRSFTLRHWAPGSSGGIVCVSCQSLQSLSWTLILVELCLAKGPKQLHIKHRISSDRVWLG